MDVKEKLVELLADLYSCDPAYYDVDARDIAQHLVDHVVAFQKWISVDDRLPEDDKQRVMVAYIGDYPIGYPKIDTDRYVRGHWVRYGSYVTHWMPLPEPPKEG